MVKRISETSTLAELKAQLARQEALSRVVAEKLPEPLQERFRGAVLKADGRLILFFSSQAFSFHLRFLEAGLKRALDPRFAIRKIEGRVLPDALERPPPPPPPLPSQEALSEMARAASSCRDPELKEEMVRLIRRLAECGRRRQGGG